MSDFDKTHLIIYVFCISSIDGRIDFATFLEIMYQHSQSEKCQQEIMAAFQSQDTMGRGTVNAGDLVHTLTNFGERLSKQEGELVMCYL